MDTLQANGELGWDISIMQDEAEGMDTLASDF